MAENTGNAPASAETDYERREIPLLPLALVALGVVIFLGLAPLIILAGFSKTAHDVDRRLAVLPPRPRLQIDPRRELEAYLAKERKLLGSYGWVDRAHGIARIPISAAMTRMVRQGIAGFPEAPPQATQAQGIETPGADMPSAETQSEEPSR